MLAEIHGLRWIIGIATEERAGRIGSGESAHSKSDHLINYCTLANEELENLAEQENSGLFMQGDLQSPGK